jgi:hypothetical protein
MRMPHRALLAPTVLVVAGVLLVGCATPQPVTHETTSPAPSESAKPVFASDAEALAAATAIYRKYEAAADAVGHDGGLHPERIRPYISDAGYQFELSDFKELQTQKAHLTGRTTLNNVKLQSHEERDSVAVVTIYLCEDISHVDRVGPDGRSLNSEDRDDYVAYQSVLTGVSPSTLVIQSIKYWEGGDICAF